MMHLLLCFLFPAVGCWTDEQERSVFGIYARISAWGNERTKSDAYSAAVIQVSNDQGAEYNAIRAGLHVRIIHMPLTSTESHCDRDFITVCSNSRSLSSGISNCWVLLVSADTPQSVQGHQAASVCTMDGMSVMAMFFSG
jgi:hypothetical protein